MKPTVTVIGYASDLAANDRGAANGPRVLQASHYLKSFPLEWAKILKTTDHKHQSDALNPVHALCKELALETQRCVTHKHPFLVLGGDHSCAIGTWSGVAHGLKAPLGLIWIDAHMDAHTFETSETKNIHGMPVATLLGYGDPSLVNIGPEHFSLLPENVVLIGIRSFEEGEANLLKKLNVRIYFMDEIQKRGIHQVLTEAVAHVSKKTKNFGISIDLDGFDPQDAPGVSTAEKGGMHASEFLTSLSLIANNPNFIGAEIVEFNPTYDRNHITEQLIGKLVENLFFKEKS